MHRQHVPKLQRQLQSRHHSIEHLPHEYRNHMQHIADTLRILADGEFHSGEHLAQQLHVSRATVWKQIDAVRQAGLDVFAVRGKGYKLAHEFELIDKHVITTQVNHEIPAPPIDVFWSLESTNAHAMALAKQGLENGYTCIAEQQTQGRGRRGRIWQSPIGGNIYLSQYWQLSEGLSSAGGLSLAAAVAVIKALRQVLADNARDTPISDLGVKWPNDIVHQGKKLAGILMEVSGESSGPCHLVVGVGINVHLTDVAAQAIDQPWTDLQTIATSSVPRNRLLASLIIELLRVQQHAERNQLETYLQQWRELDAYLNRQVVVHSPKGDFQGIVRGIDATGALQLACNGKLLSFHSGEVSLRVS